MIKKIVTFGASITVSAWWTWKDFLQIESRLPILDLSRKGAGNEYMTHALAATEIDSETLVVGMLTNVDKFDWYVQDQMLSSLREEKHQPIAISDGSGFWCTGSWFPGKKSIYQEFFYNIDYFCTKTIQQILLIQDICRRADSRLIIVFDSPIWHYTEQQLNRAAIGAQGLEPIDMLDLPLSRRWGNLLTDDQTNINSTSLIGYCLQNQLQWGNAYYRGHPPASSHQKWYEAVLRPRIEDLLPLELSFDLEHKIQQMDAIWLRG